MKACQCDIKNYGNILHDDFAEIYARMSEWRNGGVVPSECSGCSREDSCRGGCRVEAYARGNDRRTFPAFADRKHVPLGYAGAAEIKKFASSQAFSVSPDTRFLKDMECFRVSCGILAVHLSDEFAEWLMKREIFTFRELWEASGVGDYELGIAVNMLLQNKIIIEC